MYGNDACSRRALAICLRSKHSTTLILFVHQQHSPVIQDIQLHCGYRLPSYKLIIMMSNGFDDGFNVYGDATACKPPCKCGQVASGVLSALAVAMQLGPDVA